MNDFTRSHWEERRDTLNASRQNWPWPLVVGWLVVLAAVIGLALLGGP